MQKRDSNEYGNPFRENGPECGIGMGCPLIDWECKQITFIVPSVGHCVLESSHIDC